MLPFLIPIAIGAVGGLMSGMQQRDQLQSDADALRKNALFLNRAATDAKQRGLKDADLSRVGTQQLIGSQRAAMAASGGQVDTGSNAILQQDAAQLGEFEALTIANNAAREAYGYQIQATDASGKASGLSSQAGNVVMKSVLGGALQGGASSFGSMFGGGGGATGGINMQGQSRALTNNTAFVKNM